MSTMNSTTIPRAPKGLSERSKRLWRGILREFELSEAELELLTEGLRALDRAEQARAEVDAQGVTVLDRYGVPKAHPSVDIEHRARAQFASIIRQLGVREVEPTPAGTRGARPYQAQTKGR